ncbi:hypothetical protein BG418_18380 [Streptomyces sp. CBMA152]|nr:hypothetical protein [Streptomyces sp. CBMA152]
MEGATAPPPPAPPNCRFCGLAQDRFATPHSGHWVLLEPGVTAPAHRVPPRRRWIIGSDGTAYNTWDAEPTPGAVCRIAHRLVCPEVPPDVPAEDPRPWATAMREENRRQRDREQQRLPEPGELPDAG